MIRRPPRSTPLYSSAASDVYKRQGYTYDEDEDVFIPPQPYSKWTLNETTWLWEAPEDYPDDGKDYVWNDNKGEWEEVEE